MSAAAMATTLELLERQLAGWVGEIAVAAEQGSGLDKFQAALNWAKQDVPTDKGLREKAKQDLVEAAERHLGNAHSADVLDAIYYDIFPEDRERDADTSASNDELDAKTIEDNRNQIKAKIKCLANLPALEYAQERKAAAQELGVGVGALDSAVKAERDKAAREQTDFLPHWNVEQWQEPVDGAALLEELRTHFKHYVVLPKWADVTLALWVLLTWIFDCFDITPYLAITSPTRRCGKTLLMTMLYWLCWRAKKNDSMSKASIYRSVEAERPTLVLDEVGWVTDQKDERQGILCGGFERLGHVEICEGEGADITTKRYSTYCPKAFGLIGKLTATLMDRSIEIAMQRKRSEKVERLRRRDNEQHAELRRKCLRWANDNREALAKITPKELAGLNDRAFDAWEPLLAIAEHAGGDWLKLATDAAIALSRGESVAEERGVEALHDIKAEFDRTGRPAITTKTVIKALCVDEERPWTTYANGKPITDRQLAKLLKPFDIISENVQESETGEPQAKGYRRARFDDAFSRYLTPAFDASRQIGGSQASNRPNADGTGITDDFSVRPESVLDGNEKCEKPASDVGLDAWTAKKPQPDDKGCFDQRNASNGTAGFRCDASLDDADDLAFLDRRDEFLGHRVCGQCGEPGGTDWKYDGVEVRLHSYCEQPWIESYEAKLSKASQSNNHGQCDVMTDRRGVSGHWETEI